ncbi:MAG: hypothetical protein ABI353_20355 [Isosphaeraceae bacterium]
MPIGEGPQRRWKRLIGAALVVVAVVFGLVLVPEFLWAIPFEVSRWLVHPLTFLVLAGVALLVPPPWPTPRVVRTSFGRLARLPERFPGLWSRLQSVSAPIRRVGPWIERLNRATDGFLGRPLSFLVGLVCLVMLLTWAPHFLTWPWWCDLDQFATSARAWEAGIVPYRDLEDFDFPGPIYLLWPLGKLFGWGRTAPIYALDLVFVVLLGVRLLTWSRQRFGRLLPGLAGFLVFLGYYLGLDYSMVAQRDWQGPLFVVIGLMTMEAWPGRWGRLISAALMGLAMAFRPQVVLFLPALASAIDEGSRRLDEPWTKGVRPLVEWVAAFGCFTVLAFGPLFWAGVMDDFIARLRVASYGGSYNHLTLVVFTQGLHDHLDVWWTTWTVAAVALLGLFGPPESRRQARTWALASLSILLYRPLSPVHHQYLYHPWMLVWSIDVALIVNTLVSARQVLGPLRGPAVLALLVAGVGRVPPYCTIVGSLNAVPSLVRGNEPMNSPPGSEPWFPNRNPDAYYQWSDYCELLAYLRRLDPEIRVANVLRTLPFPTINGPSGRVTPFPAAGGVLHLGLVDPDLEAGFAKALEETPNVLVVWENSDNRVDTLFLCKHLTRTIRQFYQPIRQFGRFQVWARKQGPPATIQ